MDEDWLYSYDYDNYAYDPEPIPCSECGQEFWTWYGFDTHECLD
jgi:hypothetical protein